MNAAIEFHDSRLEAVDFVGPDLVIRLRPAYVHRWEGEPGVGPRSGWLQDVDVVVIGAVLESSPPVYPVEIADGEVVVGCRRWNNLVPLPCDMEGETMLLCLTAGLHRLSVRGVGISVEATGEPRYVEEVP